MGEEKRRETGKSDFCFLATRALPEHSTSHGGPGWRLPGRHHPLPFGMKTFSWWRAHCRATFHWVLTIFDLFLLTQNTMKSCALLACNFWAYLEHSGKGHLVGFSGNANKIKGGGPLLTAPRRRPSWNSQPSASRSSRFTIAPGWITWKQPSGTLWLTWPKTSGRVLDGLEW